VKVTNLPDAITDHVNACHYTIIRTWMATDAAGNTNSASFRILVSDTTPPTLVGAPDRTVTAGTAWDFDQPTAADNCSSVTLSVLSTVTNTPSQVAGQNAVLITRVWTATDTAGNTNTCQQTITVLAPVAQDPPLIAANPQWQTVGSGNSTTLSVTATGSGPFTYQWRLNGNNLAGATGSSLSLNGLDLTNAGIYTVVVTGSGGSVASQAAVVNVLPRLVERLSGSVLTLTWPAGFRLQSANSPAGVYTDVAGATSPFLYNVATQPLRFFRLTSQPFELTVQPLAGGQVRISGPGVPGCNFIIQASTDLIHWVNLATNPSPFVVVDTEAGQGTRRFYRAIPATTTAPIASLTPPSITTQPVGQTAGFGKSATLTVTATGSAPFTYQWQLNGENIAGATGSSLALSGLQFSDAGLYSVVVSNPAGSATSAVAVLNVTPTLSMQATGGGIVLTWPGGYVLQGAVSAAGPYADVPGATSPYFYSTLTSALKFFRLRPQSFNLTMVTRPDGQVSVTGTGVPGCNFLLQASTDLVHWVDVQTSPSPCAFVDKDAQQYPHRFYRVVLAQ
jgi:hypothetical protein